MTGNKIQTEVLGLTLERAMCFLYNTDYQGTYKYSLDQARELAIAIRGLKDHLGENLVHTAQHGSPFDFTSQDKTFTVSVKSVKKDGKVAPQIVGQLTRNMFWKRFFPLGPAPPHHLQPSQEHADQFTTIKTAITQSINHMIPLYVQHTFESAIVYYNQHKQLLQLIKATADQRAALIKALQETTITFSHIVKEKEWNESTTLIANGHSLGELQIHRNRNCIKFRWMFERLLLLYADHFSITTIPLYTTTQTPHQDNPSIPNESDSLSEEARVASPTRNNHQEHIHNQQSDGAAKAIIKSGTIYQCSQCKKTYKRAGKHITNHIAKECKRV